MAKTFGDYALAAQMRDAIERICVSVVERMRPRQQYGIVESIDRVNKRCGVLFRGDEQSISIPMGSIQPAVVGQVVRIVGTPDDRYIADVIGPGNAYFAADTRVTAASTTTSSTQNIGLVPFSRTGSLSPTIGSARFQLPFNATILGVSATVSTAPSGTSIILDLNRNGITLFSNQGNRPQILSGQNSSQEVDPDVVDMNRGDYLTLDIDQVGNVIPGSDLTAIVRYRNDDA